MLRSVVESVRAVPDFFIRIETEPKDVARERRDTQINIAGQNYDRTDALLKEAENLGIGFDKCLPNFVDAYIAKNAAESKKIEQGVNIVLFNRKRIPLEPIRTWS